MGLSVALSLIFRFFLICILCNHSLTKLYKECIK